MNIRLTLLLLLTCLVTWGCSKKKGPEPAPGKTWSCTLQDSVPVDWLDTLGCQGDFDALEGEVPDGPFGQIRSAKVVYSLAESKLYWINSKRYEIHFDFAVGALGYPADEHSRWDSQQYRHNDGREYLLGTVNYYAGARQWVLEFYAGDDMIPQHMLLFFNAAQGTAWFGDSLKYFPANDTAMTRASTVQIPMISEQEIFGSQQYQCLNSGDAYGILTRASANQIPSGNYNRRTILYTDGLPNDLPVVAGIVTASFQTPLSHINVLSRNRGTPNMALRSVWTDSVFSVLEGQLVHLQARLDGYTLEPTDSATAQAYWALHDPTTPPLLALDTSSDTLVYENGMGRHALAAIGAKAANFGELRTLSMRIPSLFEIPQASFAIPVVHYRRHLERHGLWAAVDSMLSNAEFQSNSQTRRLALESLQARIRNAPVDTVLLNQVLNRMIASGQPTLRFRSSTNAEDLREFNGAGLYTSATGGILDPNKTIEKAIQEVWASLWGIRAYEERQFYGIDHRRASMGILAHSNFTSELANGVAITHNIYQPEYWGFVINAQDGETSVVNPPAGVLCEQFIYYPWDSLQTGDIAVRYISRSTITQGAAVLNESEIQALGRALMQIHEHFYIMLAEPNEPYWQFGMDVEFKFDGVERRLVIKQARPLP